MNLSLLTRIDELKGQIMKTNNELAMVLAEKAYYKTAFQELIEDVENLTPWEGDYADCREGLKKSVAKAKKVLAEGVGVENGETNSEK